MYDFTHCLSDAIEGITHSLCTLEFENNRPLYDWFLDQLPVPFRPEQTEFARLNLSYTVVSKRKLLKLVEEGVVDGWSDPRMPTLSGIRRRGFTPKAIRHFCDRIGVARRDSQVDIALLEHAVREDLNEWAPRVMGVLNPLKVVLTNYPEDREEELEAPNHPTDPSLGSRRLPFSRELFIEREDFKEDPPRKFFRLAPGREVRLRYGYLITCVEVVKDSQTGEVVELHCTFDPETRGGNAPDGRKVKATLHWVSARHAFHGEVRLYDRLFLRADPEGDAREKDFMAHINPDSLKILEGCKLEPMLRTAAPGDIYQFERMGYFCVDTRGSRQGAPVFNRAVTLRDAWAKIQANQEKKGR
jgi:glutaminyl-tRNA synthetase